MIIKIWKKKQQDWFKIVKKTQEYWLYNIQKQK